MRDLAALREATARVPADHCLHNNLCSDMLAVAEHMLRGELFYRLGECIKDTLLYTVYFSVISSVVVSSVCCFCLLSSTYCNLLSLCCF